VPTLSPSCGTDGGITGDPAVRLSEVVRSAVNHLELATICKDNYDAEIGAIAERVLSSIGSGCLPAPFSNPAQPSCTVTDGLQGTSTNLPACSQNGNVQPCWLVTSVPGCSQPAISVSRVAPPPSGTVTTATCQLAN
jgi:hypothetical protein